MPIIGKPLQTGGYHVLDALSASSTNSYTMQLGSANFTPESANHLIVSLNGVIQKPGSAFTVSGSTLTFVPSSGTLSSSDSIDFIIALGRTMDIGTPSDGTVTNAKLAQDIISGETALTDIPADTDELLISDAGTLKRIDYSLVNTNRPYFEGQLGGGNQAISDATLTKLLVTEILDSDSMFASNKWTPTTVGYYYIYAGVTNDVASGNLVQTQARIYKNGSNLQYHINNYSGNPGEAQTTWTHAIEYLDGDDYIEFYAYSSTNDSGDGSIGSISRFGGFRIA